jgi:Domain of unknown function (DUF4158)
VPVEFLTDEQVAVYGQYTGPPSRAQLERCFVLDHDDLMLALRRRSPALQLGFAVQLGTVRFLGRFLLEDPVDVPTEVVDYLAEQLSIADPSCTKAYTERPKTAYEHAWEIQRALRYRDFPDAEAELAAWVDARAWNTGDGPKALFDAAVAWLVEQRVLLPGVSRLARLVARVREQANERLWAALAAAATPRRRVLERLLRVEPGERVSELERLRRGPTRVSGKSVTDAVDRAAELAALGFGPDEVDLQAVPARRLAALARHGMTSKAPVLARLAPDRRTATLLATVRHLQATAVDDVLDLFDVLMASNLLARAERTSLNEQVRSLPTLAKAAGTVARAVTALLAAAEEDPQAPIGAVWARVDQLAPRQEVQAAADQVLEQLPPSDSDADQAWRAELVKRYGVVRLFLPSLVEAIDLDATADGRPVLAALRRLPELAGRKKVHADEVDTSLLAGSWRRLVLAAPGLEGSR